MALIGHNYCAKHCLDLTQAATNAGETSCLSSCLISSPPLWACFSINKTSSKVRLMISDSMEDASMKQETFELNIHNTINTGQSSKLLTHNLFKLSINTIKPYFQILFYLSLYIYWNMDLLPFHFNFIFFILDFFNKFHFY